ncbi:hypothetical protein [Evansella vedderi]|uniref:hypothetical protein n=1 Tax=Evansella vedderi TaxID=38282 RepID=UPI0027D8F3B6|nr:hypothetical protein [Evansella vedderi]
MIGNAQVLIVINGWKVILRQDTSLDEASLVSFINYYFIFTNKKRPAIYKSNENGEP